MSLLLKENIKIKAKKLKQKSANPKKQAEQEKPSKKVDGDKESRKKFFLYFILLFQHS